MWLAAAGAELHVRIQVAQLYFFGEAGWSKRPFSKAAARSTARSIMSATLVDAGETVSRQCLRAEAYPQGTLRV